MAGLQAFYKDNAIKQDNIKRVVVSTRFLDEVGNPIPWELKALSPKRYMDMSANMIDMDEDGIRASNMTKATFDMIAEVVQFPNLRDVELQESYGVMGVDKLLDVMLEAKEFSALQKEVSKLHKADKKLESMVEEAKND